MNGRWLLAACLLAGRVEAQTPTIHVDCADLRLVDASGAGDDAAHQHLYRFAGSCRLFEKTGATSREIGKFPVTAFGTWDTIEKRFHESVRVGGSLQWDGKRIGGEMTSAFRCSDDPLLAPAACNGFAHQNRTALEAMSGTYKQQGRPLLVGRCTPAQVRALSATHTKARK
jgi:hypothetical protein